jgi:hypothetical protein
MISRDIFKSVAPLTEQRDNLLAMVKFLKKSKRQLAVLITIRDISPTSALSSLTTLNPYQPREAGPLKNKD